MEDRYRDEGSRGKASRRSSTESNSKVTARIDQAVEAKVNIRLVPSRDITLSPEALGCQPRHGSDPAVAVQIRFPEGLAEKLREADKKVIDWLGKDEANGRRFLEDPVGALEQSGVELSRAEQKALWRAQLEAADGRIVPPGVNVTEVSIEAAPKGRVGRDRRPTRPGTVRDAGCC
ncbi:MAG: hypothetical protein M3N53_12880 [Actinomycetota bacterium]|nr:hypothetical protein [Actinomycetota bacterium]